MTEIETHCDHLDQRLAVADQTDAELRLDRALLKDGDVRIFGAEQSGMA